MIGHCLHDSFFLGCHFQSLETEIVPPMTRCLNRGTDFDTISILNFRIADEWSAAEAQYGNRNCRFVVFQTEQVRAITVIAIGNCVGGKRLHISYGASQCGMSKMIDPRFFEYRLDAGRFLCPHRYRCVCSQKCE